MNSTHDSIHKNIWRACAFVAIVASLVVTGTARATLTDNFSTAYVEECFNAGVPLPPVFGTTFNNWKYTGQLSASQVFVDPAQPADVYYYVSTGDSAIYTPTNTSQGVYVELGIASGKNPEGVCMAIIRKAADTQSCATETGLNYSDSFQVICQGKNGKACFWNLKPGNTFPWAPGSKITSDYVNAHPNNIPSLKHPPANRAIQPPFSYYGGAGAGPQCYKTASNAGGLLTAFESPPFTRTTSQVGNGYFDTYIVQRGGLNEAIDGRGATALPAWVGGSHLVGNREGVCTACHAGENVFINHPGTATDINPLSPWRVTNGSTLPHVPVNFYFPTTWPNPIVPKSDTKELGGAPWPQNPAPTVPYTSQYSSGTCLSCHGGPPSTTQVGGRFPNLADLGTITNKNYCNKVMSPSVLRQGSSPQKGAMPPGTAADTDASYYTDRFAQSALDNECAAPLKAPNRGANGVNTSIDGTRIHKSSYGSGFHQHYFTGHTMPSGAKFNADDLICADGFISSTGNQTPSEVMLQFQLTNNDWGHRAYWGSNTLGPMFGAVGNMDNVQIANSATQNKKTGVWQPYCVRANLVGLEGKNATGAAFTLYGGSMWWGNLYRYANGKGAPQMLFTTSNASSATLSADAADFWQITSTPAFLYWNPASWSSSTFSSSSKPYGYADQIGNINLGAVQDNYCYMNSFKFAAEDEIALSLIGGGASAPWSLGGWSNAPSGRSRIGANCIPWKEMVSATTRGKMGASFPPVVINGEWKDGNYNDGPSKEPTILGGSPSTNLCALDGLWGYFNTLPGYTANLSIAGTGSNDGPSGWFAVNKTPNGLTACTDVGLGKLSPVPASAYTRGQTNWYALNVGMDVSKQTGAGKDANNQFCYLVGVETKDAAGDVSVNLLVADGTNAYTDNTGATIPAGHWIAYGTSGAKRARIACQSVPY